MEELLTWNPLVHLEVVGEASLNPYLLPSTRPSLTSHRIPHFSENTVLTISGPSPPSA